MVNSADPDVGFFRSQLIWIYTVCKCRVYPGSAGLGLKVDNWAQLIFFYLFDVFIANYTEVFYQNEYFMRNVCQGFYLSYVAKLTILDFTSNAKARFVTFHTLH